MRSIGMDVHRSFAQVAIFADGAVVESYRRRTAVERRKGPGRPPSRATIKDIAD